MELDIFRDTMETTRRDPALDARFQALSDEKRLRVLELLRDGERCVCDLTEALDVGQSLLSFHLKTLKEAGLVRARRDGRWVHYSLDEEGLRALRDRLAGLVEAARGPSGSPVPRCC
jgi:ArsR family transcriptional regulator